MKEAAGEANMTVITIVLIGVVAAVGLLLVPRLMTNAKSKACCTDAGWFISGQYCCNPKEGQACANQNQRAVLGSNQFKQFALFKECMQ